jgi:hypothetical protein
MINNYIHYIITSDGWLYCDYFKGKKIDSFKYNINNGTSYLFVSFSVYFYYQTEKKPSFWDGPLLGTKKRNFLNKKEISSIGRASVLHAAG